MTLALSSQNRYTMGGISCGYRSSKSLGHRVGLSTKHILAFKLGSVLNVDAL